MTRRPHAAKPRSAVSDRMAALGAVADTFDGWEPAADVLTEVKAVSTIFPQVDVATRIGGWPLQRVCLIHGPSNHGKTLFMHGLGKSFLMAEHYYLPIDAEFTTDMRWLRSIMGSVADLPTFRAKRPVNFEETTRAVRDAVTKVAKARDEKRIPETTSALIGVDSIRKLIPENVLAKIEKEEGGVDGRGGTTAMYKAALNAAWMDELVPLLYHTNSTLVIIARESEKIGATKYEKQFTIGGGKSIVYDSSVVARITRAEYVTDGKKENMRVLGERHRVAIHKTKIAGKDDKEIVAFFHSSNGVETPEGFDRARDVFELAADHGVITKAGKEYVDPDGQPLGLSENAAVRELRKTPERVAEIEAQAREAATKAVMAGALVAHESSPDAPGADVQQPVSIVPAAHRETPAEIDSVVQPAQVRRPGRKRT